jgi:hypothetical protein
MIRFRFPKRAGLAGASAVAALGAAAAPAQNVRFSIAAGVKRGLLTSGAFLDVIDLRGLMSPHGALASLRGRRLTAS